MVVLDLGPLLIPSAVAHALMGRDTRYLRIHIRSSRIRNFLVRIGISPVNLGEVAWVSSPDESDEWAGRYALSLVASWKLETVLEKLAMQFPDAKNSLELIRVGILTSMYARTPDLTITNWWLRSQGYERAVVFGTSYWDRHVLGNCNIPIRAPRLPQRIEMLWSRTFQIFKSALIRRPRRGQSNEQGPVEPSSVDAVQSGGHCNNSRVLFVANYGFTYGNLYSYEQFLSDDPDSPLHPTNLAYVSRVGQHLMNDSPTYGVYQMMGPRSVRLRSTWRFMWTLVPHARRSPVGVLWFLARFCARAHGLSNGLRAQFPNAEVAMLTYELQMPTDFILALDNAGITSVAANERPNTGIASHFPLAVHSLMTASPFFAQAISESPVAAVVDSTPCGMWRTDLLWGFRSQAPKPKGNLSRQPHQKLLVALPFHITEVEGNGESASETSAKGVHHFLSAMLALAYEHEEYFIEIRGKNDDWTRDPRLLVLTQAIEERANIEVNHEYGSLNVSYQLCSQSDLIIAKYTSLVDECLALSIPCIVHDFTHNSSGRQRRISRYLPEDIFAESEAELEERIRFALMNQGNNFRDWWEPTRARVYGNLNDGKVRERMRSYIESLT